MPETFIVHPTFSPAYGWWWTAAERKADGSLRPTHLGENRSRQKVARCLRKLAPECQIEHASRNPFGGAGPAPFDKAE